MKEVQDDQWVGKIKELLEDYTPADEAGDWKQVRQKLNRSLPWGTRLQMFFRIPWMLALIFGTGILVGYLLFNSPDKALVNQTTSVEENPAAPSIVKSSENKTPAATVTTGKQITSVQKPDFCNPAEHRSSVWMDLQSVLSSQ